MTHTTTPEEMNTLQAKIRRHDVLNDYEDSELVSELKYRGYEVSIRRKQYQGD